MSSHDKLFAYFAILGIGENSSLTLSNVQCNTYFLNIIKKKEFTHKNLFYFSLFYTKWKKMKRKYTKHLWKTDIHLKTMRMEYYLNIFHLLVSSIITLKIKFLFSKIILFILFSIFFFFRSFVFQRD